MGAADHLVINRENLRSAYSQPINVTLKGERHAALLKEGHAQEHIDEAENLLTAHGADAGSQQRAHAEIKRHISEATPVGRVLLDHINMEEKALDAYNEEHAHRVKDAEARARREHREKPWSRDFDSEDEAADYARRMAEKGKGLKVYRKASHEDTERHIHSWSTNAAGAGASLSHRGAAHFAPNQEADVQQLRAEGWRVLGGVGRMMGAPGESEVTLIHLGRVGGAGKKATALKALQVEDKAQKHDLQSGARGGKFYLTATGNKVYVGKKK